MPTNLYGPRDNFHDKDSHVIPALIRRFHEAKVNNLKTVVVWGTGKPKREFLHVNDLADAAIFMMKLDKELFWKNKKFSNSQINIGTGQDIDIKSLTLMISRIIGYKGKVDFDSSMPDGTPRKLLDVTKAKNYGWECKIDLEEGLKMTYDWYVSNKNVARHQ
jgi:nucleoside-diphosphate-sugar epimerase